MMKIHSDQYVEATQQEQAKAKKAEAKTDFGELLGNEVAKAGTNPAQVQNTTQAGPAIYVNPLLSTQMTEKVQGVELSESEVLSTMDGMLDQMDRYSQALQSGSTKEAWGQLESIQAGVDKLRADEGPASKTPAISAMVDELDVLATTETFKFNRGDYV